MIETTMTRRNTLAFWLLLGFCVTTAVVSANTNNVLFLGDSWAQYARTNSLESVCPNTEVRNIGQAGSRASAWADSLLDSRLGTIGDFVPDYVWISLGLNDFAFSTGCNPAGGPAGVANDLQTITDRLAELYPNATFLLTGTSVPASDGFPCTNQATYQQLRSVYTDYDYNNATAIVLIEDLFGGSIDNNGASTMKFSDSSFYSDSIHLNDDGYEVFFTYPPVAEELGCLSSNTTVSSSSTSDAVAVNRSLVSGLLLASLLCALTLSFV